MTDLDNTRSTADGGTLIEDVHVLAARALAVLAEDRVAQPQALAERIHWLSGQACSMDAEDLGRAIDRVLGDGVSIDDVIDHVLPAVARRLGELWFADDISFVDVSIGTARLQESVRRLRARERNRCNLNANDARVLMVIPGPEEHTLGVFVAADQLRRLGVTIDLSVAERRTDLVARLRATRYDMIGITASGVRTIASVKELAKTIRQSTQQFVPIVVGGPLADDEHLLHERTPIDLVTTDICAAARRYGVLPAEAEKTVELDR